MTAKKSTSGNELDDTLFNLISEHGPSNVKTALKNLTKKEPGRPSMYEQDRPILILAGHYVQTAPYPSVMTALKRACEELGHAWRIWEGVNGKQFPDGRRLLKRISDWRSVPGGMSDDYSEVMLALSHYVDMPRKANQIDKMIAEAMERDGYREY